jgi:hypothetical protein
MDGLKVQGIETPKESDFDKELMESEELGSLSPLKLENKSKSEFIPSQEQID